MTIVVAATGVGAAAHTADTLCQSALDPIARTWSATCFVGTLLPDTGECYALNVTLDVVVAGAGGDTLAIDVTPADLLTGVPPRPSVTTDPHWARDRTRGAMEMGLGCYPYPNPSHSTTPSPVPSPQNIPNPAL